MWAAGLCLAGACASALLAVPAVVFVVCAFVLVIALFWRSRARRSDGKGFVPNAFVWAALAALVLSLGATALRAVIPEGGLQWGQTTAIRAGDAQPASSGPTTAASPVATQASTASNAAASVPPSSAPPTRVASEPKPSAPPAPVAPVVSAPVVPPSSAAPSPAPTKCSQSLPLGLLPTKNCG
ncbi:hypothetical protein SPF06_05770 [Sinomonas sp. JGH33]|uniref:Uncharacterized protein n=1 Tax=Sinomonas terricola TaxID=3110330 RepID=A0ABU5T3H9_9MICC|nr:hypothetical protein [Sinomonas sp. JGH33]MEA5454228.1 hypothetical protein [Sinomonas sp. JGH33]